VKALAVPVTSAPVERERTFGNGDMLMQVATSQSSAVKILSDLVQYRQAVKEYPT